jgi:glycosyltransferase involved in cell wall biosynthesis
MKSPPTPIMILSDAPTSGTGLGRISGDIALRIAQNLSEQFRVCTFGYGGVVSRKLPYHQYIIEGMEDDWVTPTLPEAWSDWVGDEKGILLTIWDLSRLGWLLRPEMHCENRLMQKFLSDKPFEKWVYLPLDAEGPNGKLTYPLEQLLGGANRILGYGKWGASVLDRTLGVQGKTEYVPHGINTSVFYQRDRATSRKEFVSYTCAIDLNGSLADRIRADETLISIVGTNQARKDWALAIETVAMLAKSHNVRLWIKTDKWERHWSIPALLIDYGLKDRSILTLAELTDDELARAYSASDLTLGIAPEGFGYVHVESLACGTPCIVGSYAGGAELVEPGMRVDPIAFRYEGVWSCKRPVYNPADWVSVAKTWIGKRATMDPKYDWKNNWGKWEEWILSGRTKDRVQHVTQQLAKPSTNTS